VIYLVRPRRANQ